MHVKHRREVHHAILPLILRETRNFEFTQFNLKQLERFLSQQSCVEGHYALQFGSCKNTKNRLHASE